MTQQSIHRHIYLIGPVYPAKNATQFTKLLNQRIKETKLDHIIYIDAAVQLLPQIQYINNSTLQFSVGDADGEALDGDESYAHLLNELHPSSKSQSDLALALKYLLEKEIKINDQGTGIFNIHAFGLWGERFDHQLANIGEFFNFLKDAPTHTRITLYSYQEHALKKEALLTRGSHQDTYKGCFSIFQLEQSPLSITGAVRYPLSHHKLEGLSSLGLSNEAFGEYSIEGDGPYMLIFP